MKNYGCANRLPHDYKYLYENPAVKVEQCSICGDIVKFQKDNAGRIDNDRYLEAHIRNFAQSTGPTAEVYYACWHPDEYERMKGEWVMSICTDRQCMGSGKCRHPRVVAERERDITQAGTNGEKQPEVEFYANTKTASISQSHRGERGSR